MDRGDVSRSLDAEDEDGEVPCDLIHLPTAALTFHLEFPEVRDEHAEELDHDGSGDVRHHTQRED